MLSDILANVLKNNVLCCACLCGLFVVRNYGQGGKVEKKMATPSVAAALIVSNSSAAVVKLFRICAFNKVCFRNIEKSLNLIFIPISTANRDIYLLCMK